MVIGYSLYLLFDREALIFYLSREIPGPLTPPGDGQLWLAYGLAVLPAWGFALAMWEVRRFFALLGRSAIFDRAAPRILVRLGWIAIGLSIAGVLVRTLIVLVMTSANPPGQRQLAIGISSSDIAALMMGLLFLAFALVMQEALIIEDENRGFV